MTYNINTFISCMIWVSSGCQTLAYKKLSLMRNMCCFNCSTLALNSEGKQFNQYQQSSHPSTHWTQKTDIQVLVWDRNKMRRGSTGKWDSNPSLLITYFKWLYIYKWTIKHLHVIHFHPKRHTITKLNDNINMDGTIARLMNNTGS